MEAVLLSDIHARLGTIVLSADRAIATIEARERMARRLVQRVPR